MNITIRKNRNPRSWYLRPGLSFPDGFYSATPLHFATGSGNVQISRILLDYGATVDSTDDWHYTPLHSATENGLTAIINLLLNPGANPNSQDHNLNTPCILAASRGDLRSLRALVGRGSDLRLRNLNGSTALHHAAWSNLP